MPEASGSSAAMPVAHESRIMTSNLVGASETDMPATWPEQNALTVRGAKHLRTLGEQSVGGRNDSAAPEA
jgi:hypothetical protein